MRLEMVISKDPDSSYSVHFPRFHGCYGAGDTFAAAAMDGIDALLNVYEADFADCDEALVESVRQISAELKQQLASIEDAHGDLSPEHARATA